MRTLFLFIVSFYLISSVDVIYSQSTRNYEVLKYDLYVDWTDILLSNRNEIEKRKWNGTMKIKLVSLVNNLVEIELDAVELKINKVYLNSDLLPLDTFTTDKLLTISSNGFHLGDTIQLDIYYTYNNLYNKGFSYRNSKDIFSNNWKFDIDAPSIGTLNEPEDARYWFPCNDVPNDKALVTITADVPIGMKAASVGSLDSTRVLYYEEIEGENNEIICVERFYWSSKHPMPPYLITIAAADYEFNIEKIAINSTTTDSIDVYYYTFPGDWAGENDCNAKRNLSTTQKIMQIYSDLFGDYPFEKYGYATADYTYLGYQSLGMEHQTLTTSSRYWVKDFIPIPRFSSFAHELAHHWFGNMVTCKSWNDVWFNEGGATWLEAIYMERINDDININAYYEFMKNCRYSYLRDNDDLYDIPIGKLMGTDALFRYSVLTYSKASWIYHHLRMLLGNDIFPLFRKLLEQYKFSNISSEEFVNFFIENIPNPPHNIDIKKFIEQFIIYGGHPKYAINTDIKPENDSFLINLNLIQTQIKSETIIDNYLMYLKIDFLDSNNNLIKSEYVVNSENQQNYNFKLEKKPAKIILDTTAALLEVVENNITSIKDNINTINVFPNPSFSNNEITIISNITNIKNIAITDLQGNILIDSNLETNLKIKKYSNNKYIISIPQIKTGTYFILLNGNNVCKLIIN